MLYTHNNAAYNISYFMLLRKFGKIIGLSWPTFHFQPLWLRHVTECTTNILTFLSLKIHNRQVRSNKYDWNEYTFNSGYNILQVRLGSVYRKYLEKRTFCLLMYSNCSFLDFFHEHINNHIIVK